MDKKESILKTKKTDELSVDFMNQLKKLLENVESSYLGHDGEIIAVANSNIPSIEVMPSKEDVDTFNEELKDPKTASRNSRAPGEGYRFSYMDNAGKVAQAIQAGLNAVYEEHMKADIEKDLSPDDTYFHVFEDMSEAGKWSFATKCADKTQVHLSDLGETNLKVFAAFADLEITPEVQATFADAVKASLKEQEKPEVQVVGSRDAKTEKFSDQRINKNQYVTFGAG